jgi:cytochrome c biogenesis protein
VVTVRDGDGNVAASGPVPFLPMGPDLFSFGVIKAPDAKPGQIGLEGYFYPTFANVDGTPVNLGGKDANPLLSLNVYTGNLNLDSGAAQSVYTLDKSQATAVPGEDGKPLRVSLAPGDTVELPNGLGSVTFDEVVSWQRIQISQTPGKDVALLGVVLALLGLMGSLFIRSRRVWLRVTEGPDGTLVEVAALDRSGGADTDAVLSGLVAELQEERA